jgi:phosphate-selective porin OprO/OprP
MMRRLRPKRGVALLLVSLVVWPAFADTAAGAGDQDEMIAKMEAMIAVQQERLEALQRQVQATHSGDMDQARAAQMKQQIREVLSETEFRESLMPSTLTAGYDDGFFIKSTDDKFAMSIFGRIQVRWTYYEARSRNRYLVPGFRRQDRSGFDAQRVRFGVAGHAYTKDLTYYMELEGDSVNGYDFVFSEGFINYRFADEFQVRAGYLTLASTRASFTSNENYQFVDGPLMDAVFGMGYGVGVRLWGQVFDQKLDYYLDVVNSVTNGELDGAGRVITNDEDRELDNNPAILFRTCWHVLEGDPGVNMETQADHTMTQTPALDIGFHYVFNDDEGDVLTSRIPFPRRTFFRDGGFGLTSSRDLTFHQFGLDAAMKYMGFSTTAEYVIRVIDVRQSNSLPWSPLFQWTGDASTGAQHGAYVQCGYFLPIPSLENKIEVVARVGGISALSGGSEGTWEYAGGVNYYIVEDKVKLQADITKISELPISNAEYSYANVNDDPLIFRVQLQVAF